MRDDNRFVVEGNKIFKPLKKDKFKANIDDRFKSVLSEDKFNTVFEIKGNITKKTRTTSTNELKSLYITNETKSSAYNSNSSGRKGKPSEDRLDYLNKLSRGEISEESSSEEEEEDNISDNSSENEENIADHEENATSELGPLQIPEDEEVPTGEVSSRIAVQNCDWQHLKAIDLMMVMQSFCPAGTAIRSVTIYPSDFGLKAMAIENSYGPQGIWKHIVLSNETDNNSGEEEDENYSNEDPNKLYETITKTNNTEGEFQRGKNSQSIGVIFHEELCDRGLAEADDSEDDENKHSKSQERNGPNKKIKESVYNKEALRVYELSKLKYYFAIVDCDSVTTASILYDRMDGLEFEHSSMAFDLRFVPDDVNFDAREIKDQCLGDSISLLASRYIPPDFVVKALQHTNVDCTWDAPEKEREEKLSNISKWRALQESDLQQYVASDNSSDEDNDNKKDKIRKLLLGDEEALEDDDDFFAPDSDEADSDLHKVATFIPDFKAELAETKNSKSIVQETPFETKLREISEAKSKKKSLKKLRKKNDSNKEEEEPVNASLELMFDDGKKNLEEYDLRDIVREEKDKKKKKKRKASETDKAVDDFAVDLGDSRFSALLGNSGKYGIDPSSAEFQATPAMKRILKEQRKRSKLD